MASFEISYQKTKIHEGKYTCVKEDSGNWTGGKVGAGNLVGTNWGISAPVMAQYLKRTPTADDMKNMPESTAKAIYKANYWAPIKGDVIKSQAKADIIYDDAVNTGVSNAIKKAQRVCGVPETGRMDDLTIQKLNA